jgi:outer membrane protein assembly factor BamD
MTIRNSMRFATIVLAPAMLVSSCAVHRKDQSALVAPKSQQPDQVLYAAAIGDIQHSRYERARLSLQTLINTYDTSALLPQAKFAIADSWYREGGAKGLAQAEAECHDVLTQFPNTPAAEDAQKLLRKIQGDRAPKESSRTR